VVRRHSSEAKRNTRRVQKRSGVGSGTHVTKGTPIRTVKIVLAGCDCRLRAIISALNMNQRDKSE
jgi:hypothetical protein